MLQALNEMKARKLLDLQNLLLELIAANGVVGIQAICQKVLDGFGMPLDLALNIMIPVFKGKGDTSNCSGYGAMKFLEHGMKMVERVLEKSLHGIVTVD